MATVYSGGTYINQTFTGDTKWAIKKNVREQLVLAGWTSKAYGSASGCLGDASTVTITIATPGVVTWNSHPFSGGERVLLATTGALPTGLAVNTVYFIKYVNANTFNLSTTSGGANINTSGSQSGTHTLYTESDLLESATQANVTNPIRIRITDSRVNCVQVSLENSAATLTSTASTAAGGNLLPAAAQTMRIIATKYWGTCFVPGSTAARSFVYFGMPYVDSTILAGVTDIGVMFSNAQADNTTTTQASFRTLPAVTAGALSAGNYACIYNSSLLQSNNSNGSSNTAGGPEVLLTAAPAYSQSSTARNYRWASDALLSADVLVVWGLTATADEAKIRGQLFDMLYVGDAFAMDSVDTLNTGHSWYNLTNNFAGSSIAPRGGMWVRTDT